MACGADEARKEEEKRRKEEEKRRKEEEKRRKEEEKRLEAEKKQLEKEGKEWGTERGEGKKEEGRGHKRDSEKLAQNGKNQPKNEAELKGPEKGQAEPAAAQAEKAGEKESGLSGNQPAPGGLPPEGGELRPDEKDGAKTRAPASSEAKSCHDSLPVVSRATKSGKYNAGQFEQTRCATGQFMTEDDLKPFACSLRVECAMAGQALNSLRKLIASAGPGATPQIGGQLMDLIGKSVRLDAPAKLLPESRVLTLIAEHFREMTGPKALLEPGAEFSAIRNFGVPILSSFQFEFSIWFCDVGIRKAAAGVEIMYIKNATMLDLLKEPGVSVRLSKDERKSGHDFSLGPDVQQFMLVSPFGGGAQTVRLAERINPEFDSAGNENCLVWRLMGDSAYVVLPGEGPDDVRDASEIEIEEAKNIAVALGMRPDIAAEIALTGQFGTGQGQGGGKPEGSEAPCCPRKPLKFDALVAHTVKSFRIGASLRNFLARTAYHVISGDHVSGENEKTALSHQDRVLRAAGGLRDCIRLWDREELDTEAILGPVARLIKGLPSFREPEKADGGLAGHDKAQKRKDESLMFQACAKELLADPAAVRDITAFFNESLEKFALSLNKAENSLRRLTRGLRGDSGPRNRMLGGLGVTRLLSLRDFDRARTSLYFGLNADGTRKLGGSYEGAERFRAFISRKLEARSRLIAAGMVKLTRKPLSRTTWRPQSPDPVLSLSGRLPCAGVGMENLDNFAQNKKRSRFENRCIRLLRPAILRDCVRRACEMNALILVRVDPALTSITDGMTGAPGMRAERIPAADLAKPSVRRKYDRAAKKEAENQGTPETKCTAQILGACLKDPKTAFSGRDDVIIPQEGGSLFFSSDENSPFYGGCDADYNAAIQTSRKAGVSPDHYLPGDSIRVERETGRVIASGEKAAAMIRSGHPLEMPKKEHEEKTEKQDKNENATIEQNAFFLSEKDRRVLRESKWRTVILFLMARHNQPKKNESRYCAPREHFEAAKLSVCGHLSEMFSENFNSNETRGSPPPQTHRAAPLPDADSGAGKSGRDFRFV